jgi:hypothetical protein
VHGIAVRVRRPTGSRREFAGPDAGASAEELRCTYRPPPPWSAATSSTTAYMMTAETDENSREAWIGSLDTVAALNSQIVAAGH